MTIAPCPYPEMLQFTDADHDAMALPFRSGPYWVATDGKILAWREHGEGIDYVSKNLPTVQSVIRDVIASTGDVWTYLPAEMPNPLRGTISECFHCRGRGTIPSRTECDTCGGSGECPHCGSECAECDGEGYHDADRPGEPCPECGGLGKIPDSHRWLHVGGITTAWHYAAMLVRLRAQVMPVKYRNGVLRWRTDTLDGFVMPLIPTNELDAPRIP